MTRNRAMDANTPNAMMAEYYGQRATAGRIITEGTSPSPNGLGYPRIPGLFNEAQMLGWKGVTDAAHAKGGKIFLQLMHTGRVTALANLPTGAEVLGPTAETCAGDMYTDKHSMQPHSLPREMAMPDIAATAEEYAESAHLAITAGFDGVELHAANGMRDGVGVRKASQKEGANHDSRDSHREMTIRLSKPTCFVLLA